ncbi:MAG: P-loop NTPase [Nitrospiraceae bacterium]|nr:P-loop NTPase [Nitrospiraceae bacterium]
MSTNKTLSIAIMSGKGGVGKTNIALNLAYALYGLKNSIMLMDCDLGLANLDVLLGLTPEKNLQDLLDPDTQARDVVVSLEDPNLDFLPAATGVPELANWDSDIQTVLLEKLNDFFQGYDYLLLDLGAGISNTVTILATMTQLKCVVITPEPTSLTDSYALIKILSSQRGIKDFLIIVNMVKTKREGESTFKRLQTACRHFLGIEIVLLGTILRDDAVTKAVLSQTPLCKLEPNSKAYKNIKEIAIKIDKISATIPLLTSALNIDMLN